jgi:DNA-binding transcriptional MerR regulator
MEKKDTKPLFTLSVTAEIIGVHPRTLMIYENEKLVIPHRTRTNRRRYSQQDIRKLQFVRYLTNKRGVNLAGVGCILDVLKKFENEDFDPKKTSFPDFIETTVF